MALMRPNGRLSTTKRAVSYDQTGGLIRLNGRAKEMRPNGRLVTTKRAAMGASRSGFRCSTDILTYPSVYMRLGLQRMRLSGREDPLSRHRKLRNSASLITTKRADHAKRLASWVGSH
jgi:hypothetical protein